MTILQKLYRLFSDATDPPRPEPPSPRNYDGYDDSHEISAAMGHQGGMAVRQNRSDPYK